MSSCGRTEEVAGDWWAGFVPGNGRVRVEELTGACGVHFRLFQPHP